MTTPRFTLLVPVKEGAGAKTRLDAVGPAARADLMAAFARDAITAAQAADLVEVYVVGDADALGPALDGLEVTVLRDEGHGDLNRALVAAAQRVSRPDRGVAVMLADLPCLRTADLEAALSEAIRSGGRRFVADAEGSGTTLLAAPPGVDVEPRFGVGSAGAHAASGALPVTGELASLRLDVDTTDDLERAIGFGVGAHTARVIAALELRARG
ncbi:MAG: 2-phospho-L-lactate guanylyltransferase [Angustibacter sp.]